jgi:hypothetical protein
MPTLTVKLPASLHAQISAEAARRQTTKSAVVRERLERPGAGKPLSLAERAKHLIGSIDGPGDLSIRSKKMVGYGHFRRP